MTIKFEVKVRHTEELLAAFIRFNYKVKHAGSFIHLLILAVGGIVLGVMALPRSKVVAMLCFLLGIVNLFFLLFRRRVALARLKKADPLYQRGQDITIAFGEAEFTIDEGPEGKVNHIKYGELTRCYKDRGNYFLLINNEELQVLPRTAFVMGSSDEFEKFIIAKTKKELADLDLSFRERMKLVNAARKQAELAHDQKVAQKKKRG